MKMLLRLYPRPWRERYGDELEEVLSQRRPAARDTLDLIRGAIDAHLRASAQRPVSTKEREFQMSQHREELRLEVHAILAARDELGPEHDEHLVESLLDRMEQVERLASPAPPRRRRWKLGALLLGAAAVLGSSAAVVQHQSTHARTLVSLDLIHDPASPRLFTGAQVYHHNYTFQIVLDGPLNPADPHAFQFWLRYTNCAVTPRGAFRVTEYVQDFKKVGYRDVPTGPVVQYSSTRVEQARTWSGEYEFPVMRSGYYYLKVEIPSKQGCAWSLDYADF